MLNKYLNIYRIIHARRTIVHAGCNAGKLRIGHGYAGCALPVFKNHVLNQFVIILKRTYVQKKYWFIKIVLLGIS